MKKVLFLSYDGMTDPLGQSQVLPYLKGLSKNGYEIHLISFEKEERFKQYQEHIFGICLEANIHWHPQSYTKNPPLLSTMKDVRRMRKVAHALHQKHSFSIIHCRSYIAALIGLKLKRKFGIKFLFDIRGFWADERVDGKLWNLKNPIFRLVYTYFKRKELQFFNESDHVISLTHAGKNEILSWKNLKISDSKITIIPCCVDLDLFDPTKISATEQHQLRDSLGINPSDFVLGYVGSIGTWYMLDEMLDYFKVLVLDKENAKFLFVTGENPSIILQKAKDLDVPVANIIVTSVLHQKVPLHISLFNASIFFIRASYSKKASSPTKQGEILAMGIPLVCNAGVGDTDFVVEKYRCGVVLKDLTPESFIQSIPSIDQLNTSNFFTNAQEYFSLEKGVASYSAIYSKLC